MIPARYFCGSPYHKGPRWLLCVYFYRRRDGLQSYCMTCTKIRMRPLNMTPEARAHHYERSRQYKAARRREAGIPVRKLKNPTLRYGAGRAKRGERNPGSMMYPAPVVLRWLDMYLNRYMGEEDARPHWRVGLIKLEESDQRYINHIRNGNINNVSLTRADEFAQRYDLPLWELDQLVEADRA